MQSVSVCFYHLQKDEPYLNRLTSFCTRGDIIHVEIAFDDGFACGIWSGETVYLKKRQFRNAAYRFLRVPASARAVAAMRHFCERQVGKPFNRSGFYRSALPFCFARTTDHTQWFCSELVTACLHTAGLALSLTPHRTSPMRLYRHLHKHSTSFVDTNRFQQRRAVPTLSALHRTTAAEHAAAAAQDEEEESESARLI